MSKRSSGLGKGLGKGLGSLLPETQENNSSKDYFLCPIETIQANTYQPRKVMDNDALAELSASISQKGILQPLVVSKTGAGEYELIAGERRLRAAKLAGLAEVPVIVRDAGSQERLELALIENIQRQNLNPLEEAEAYQQLIDEFDLTQEEVAKQVGKERSTVANTIRLLNLPDYARDDLAIGIISMGHARVLLSVEDPQDCKSLRDEIIKKKLSVREAEQWAKKLKNKSKPAATPPLVKKENGDLPESYCATLNNDLVRYLGTKSKIIQNGSRGKLEIEYYSADDLERLISIIIQE